MICEVMCQMSSIMLTLGQKEDQVSEQDKMNCLFKGTCTLPSCSCSFGQLQFINPLECCLKYQIYSSNGRCKKRNLIVCQPVYAVSSPSIVSPE